MFKRLYFWLMLSATTAALVGCGGGGGSDSPLPGVQPDCQGVDASSDACLPPPDPCDAVPQPASCVTDAISITSPAANSLWAKPEMNLVVTFGAGTPAGLTLKLNGKDVSSSATIDNAQAVIAGAAIEQLLVHGNNTFEASSGTENEKVVFVYDMNAPRIIVTTAVEAGTNAVQQVAGSTLKVSGIVRDVAPISSLTINDVPATVTNGEFVAEIPHGDIYRLVATDSNGQVSNLNFAAPQYVFDPMLALQVNNSLFKLIEPIVNEIFANFDSSALTDPSERIPLGGNQIAITRLDVNKGGEPSIDMHFLPSATESLALEVVVDMPLVGMGMQLFSATGTNPLLSMDLDVASVAVTLQLAVSSDELNQFKLGLGSATPFNLGLGAFTINKLDVLCNTQQCTSLASGVNTLLNNAAFHRALLNTLNKSLAPSLQKMLADLEFPNKPLHLPMDLNADGTSDTQLSIEFAPSLLTTGTQANALVALAGRMYVANEHLPAGFKGALGSVYVDAGPVPEFASTTASEKEYDLGVALPSNFLNQAFLTLYQTGVMSSITANLAPEALGTFAAAFPTAEVIRMQLVMGSVPYMQLSHADLAGGRTAGIVMHLDNVTLNMTVRNAGETEFKPMIAMITDISANLELGIGADNYIDLDVANLVNMDIISVVPEGPFAVVPPDVIEGLIGPAVKDMLKTDTLPTMLKKTTEIAISMADSSNVALQLPFDMGMIVRELSVDASDAYMVMKIDLLDSEEVKNSTENVPFKINVSKRPAVTPEEPPAP